jgi:hypothetical protein
MEFAARAVTDVDADSFERYCSIFEDLSRDGRRRRLRFRGSHGRGQGGGQVGGALAPYRVAADAVDAQLACEHQMFEQLIAIHGQ